jgi:uncharacterized protein YecE (DUF72 family)
MHFGRVESLDGIDLALPGDAPRTQAFLRLPWGGKGRLHVGLPIWNSDTWVGSLYPEGTKPAGYLEAYAAKLHTVELNSTFYHQLDEARLAGWARRVPAGFKFCPKVFRGISEHPGAPDMPALVRQCAASFAGFEETYGLGFLQFPETFGPAQLPLLKRVLEAWPRSLPLAVELRHPGWFKDHALLDEAVNLLYRNRAATVITDTPGRRDALHTSLTQPRVMVRFQGHALAPSDSTRLDAWAERLVDWAGRGLEDVYVITHQPVEEVIPRTAKLFLLSLQRRGITDPSTWRDERPRAQPVRSLFKAENNRPEA